LKSHRCISNAVSSKLQDLLYQSIFRALILDLSLTSERSWFERFEEEGPRAGPKSFSASFKILFALVALGCGTLNAHVNTSTRQRCYHVHARTHKCNASVHVHVLTGKANKDVPRQPCMSCIMYVYCQRHYSRYGRDLPRSSCVFTDANACLLL
jgi:hypothetical protein